MLLAAPASHHCAQLRDELNSELHLCQCIPDKVVLHTPCMPCLVSCFAWVNPAKREAQQHLGALGTLEGEVGDPRELAKRSQDEWHSERASFIGGAKKQYLRLRRKKLLCRSDSLAFQQALKALVDEAEAVVSRWSAGKDAAVTVSHYEIATRRLQEKVDTEINNMQMMNSQQSGVEDRFQDGEAVEDAVEDRGEDMVEDRGQDMTKTESCSSEETLQHSDDDMAESETSTPLASAWQLFQSCWNLEARPALDADDSEHSSDTSLSA